MSLRAVKASAVLAGLALGAVACGGGGGDGSGAAPTATVDEGVKQGVEQALSSASTPATPATAPTAAAPTTMAAADALWATQRQAIVDEIRQNHWGLSADGKTVTGPAGFTIDLSKCPAGWSNTEGLTDTEIKIGHTTALSGTLADYGNIAKAMQVYFGLENDKGSFTDSTGKNRKIDLIVKDDGYDPARTIPLVDELIDSDKVFAVWTLGSPNTLKTYDKLNQRCIPQPLAMTGHPAWGDPVNRPWTTGMQLAYNTEALLWGSFLEQHIDELAPNGGKLTVAALVMNNDFGKSYDGGFQAWLAQSPIKARVDYVKENIEPSAPTITDPMTTLQSKNPQVFIAMVAGTACTQAITEAAQNGLKQSAKYLFQPSVCASSSFVGKDKVGGDGSSANGWWVVNGGAKDLTSPKYDDDYFAQFFRTTMANAGIDYKSSGSLGSGYLFAWPMVQALEIAGQLDGGLTRTNLIVALRTMDMTHPGLLDGMKFDMNGDADAYFIEGGIYQKFNSATQSWDDQGNVIELSGKSKDCAWDQNAGVCK
jgi:ABC-type branched-subunit amino acid transport system substrate-binding protein